MDRAQQRVVHSPPLQQQLAQPVQQQPAQPVQQHLAPPLQQQPAQPVQHQLALSMHQQPAQPVQHQVAPPVQQQPAQPVQQHLAPPLQQQPAQPVQHQLGPSMDQQPAQPVQQQLAPPVQQQPAVPVQQQLAQPVHQQPPQPVQQEQLQEVQQSQLLTALVAQIQALKGSVDQLRYNTSINQAETQRLREAIDQQTGGQLLNMNVIETGQLEDIQSTLSQLTTAPTRTLHPIKKLYDLPHFNGKPEEWPLFLATYEETTANFGYSPMENTIRLQRCLQGEAKEAVLALLIHPNNVTQVIETLAFRFGRPELLVRTQLNKVQIFPAISEARIESLIPFATTVENVVAFLAAAKCEHHLSNPMLLEELVMKLPPSRRFEWAKKALEISPYVTVKDFATWLNEQAKIIQLIPQSSAPGTVKSHTSHPKRMLHTNEKKEISSKDVGVRCVGCGGEHKLMDCESFRNLSSNDRWKLVKDKRLCFSCMKIGHGTATCRTKKRCKVSGCGKFHNKLLHGTTSPPPTSTVVNNSTTSIVSQQPEAAPPTDQSSIRMHTCQTKVTDRQLFRIVPVTLSGPRGHIETYAMFDEGSSITILEEAVADKLGLKGQSQPLTLQWYGTQVVTEPSRKVTFEVKGISEGDISFSLRNVRTIKDLCLPSQSFNKINYQHLKDVPVSDYSDAKPVLMIGLDNCHLGVAREVKEDRKSNKIIAARTKLGWVAYGPQHGNNANFPVVMHIRERETLRQLDQLVDEYLMLESLGVQKTEAVMESKDDIKAREMLEKLTKRVGKRFETGLLWREDNIVLPDSFKMAMRRLHNIEAKMKKDPQFASQYKAQMKSYVEKGYARQLDPEEVHSNNSKIWYLPHFAVTSPHKPGKIRIVFDAAAEVEEISLNSLLLKGPEQAKPLLSVLFQFRQGVVGVVADIQEMFSQVKIRTADQVSQRFLWRDGETDQPVRTYTMTTMIFGAACSPCSAEYIKNKNAKEFEKELPEAVRRIIDNHYVDDYVCSFANEAEAERISMEVQQIHAEGGFRLRSFLSNKKLIQQNLNGSSCPIQSSVNLESDKEVEKVLGMYWNTEDDTFRFQLKFHKIAKDVLEVERPPTKREMLSIVMSVFDPYGFLAEFLVFSKILLQNTWKTGIGWDDPLPYNLYCQWKLWWKEVASVKQFQINRCYSPNIQHARAIELHIFTDASESAFAAVGYFRILFENSVDIAFAFGKTRCAPKKLLSIPRLELQAAVLGTRLQTSIQDGHNFKISRVVYWSDSKTTLWWIRSPHRRFKPFVAHRVAEILENSNSSDWNWVPTDLNVADSATRAISPPKFVQSSRWLTGPEFLRLPENQWPKDPTIQVPDELDEELRAKMLHINQASNLIIKFTNFSSLSRLKRTIAWVLRYIRSLLRLAREKIAARKLLQGQAAEISSPHHKLVQREALTAAEISSAEKFLCKQAQTQTFREERTALSMGNHVSKKSSIYQLTPQLDQDDLLRVSGRIDSASCLSTDARRPIILPQNHAFTDLLVSHYHRMLHHQNDALIINEIRQRYWIPHIRSVLKHNKKNCQGCKIAKAKPVTPLMGQLPRDRLTPYVRPFTYTGLDYFGPLQVSIGRRREKRWVALFTCLTTRAIHLEVAGDLSTDACILCLRNFINRRGVPVRIRSDNGTNFVGAKKELGREAELFDTDRIQNEMTTRGIEWKFSCPLNPSEGGIWERMVQSVKKVLMVTLREEAPRVETLRSLLIEAENIVNSRPLTELPLTSEEDEPLTPNHFLIGSVNSTQTPNLEDTPICCRKQWRISQQLKNRFWKRWIQEYLPMLTKRSKWHERVGPLKVDDLVIICDASQPRNRWQRGRIVNVYPAADGQVRSADVRTTHGILRRPASKLAVLQVDGESLRGFTEGGMSSSMLSPPKNIIADTTTEQT